jgi:acetylglutamate kinase
LKAEKLILLTDQSGILDKDNKLIPTLNKQNVEMLINSGTIAGGMPPKTKSCFEAPMQAASRSISSMARPHALLLEIFTKEGIGTEITL